MMKRTKATVTIQDVAKAAGVSISTVSRVLNDKDDVAPETWEKVQRVIEELGYTSSLAARGMRSRRMNVIGLIMPDVGDPFSIQVMKGVNRAIKELDYDLIVYTGGDIKKESSATSFSTASPVVVVDPNVKTPDCPAVIATNRSGARLAMEHLISSGHRRIGFIGGRPELQSTVYRLLGYEDGLRQAGIPLDPELIQAGDYSMETGFSCAQRLLNLSDPPTAIFAANDQSAIGAIQAALQAGLCVPDDVSVVGFDNIPEAAYTNPGLTTIDQSVDQMGYVATEVLIRLIQGEPLESNLYKMPTRLIVRDSCRTINDTGAV